MRSDFDVLIVGGGPAGASLACALRDAPLTVGVVEAAPFSLSTPPSYDDRTLALAYGSRRIFEGIGAWEGIVRRGATPIKRIHVSDRGRFGVARLDSADAGLDALGYVVTFRTLGVSLYEVMQSQSNVTVIAPAKVGAVTLVDAGARVQVQTEAGERVLNARVVVAADGTASPVREALGIVAERIVYGQTAIICSVTTERVPDGTAYERFTESGPMALLPVDAERSALVWTVSTEQVDSVLGLDDIAFRAELERRFGERLGRFVRVGRRQAFPLALLRAREDVRARFALIGNAAHTLHPVAGQGFNLGLRDVAALAEVLADSAAAGEDPGSLECLRRYAAWRADDNRVTSAFTHSLVRIFANDYAPLAWGRSLGLVAVDLLPPVKRRLIRLTSGLGGRLPRLACGIGLRAPVS
ncbi:MAG: 2-octaprenyl-6-methoxyphenyl hydroxylase [Sulfurifustis sp.]